MAPRGNDIIVVSTPRSSNVEWYHRLASFQLAEHRFEIRAYLTAADYTVKRAYELLALWGEVFGHLPKGASFSRISGSLADYAYAYEGSLPLSVFIGCCKYEEPRSLQGHFDQTRGPLLKLLRMADRGQTLR
ncbi:hypothetical protein HPB51_011620 [Rhipicephalus microplus]|uniref:Uncharacterized protein n=1 Tax=Rhipicephalus microplus TaxID=6941 RepID=A0A9J6E920_RHIMP|nr:hypothetical protein HPB51_011620 [Rhipicephalus microplus]